MDHLTQLPPELLMMIVDDLSLGYVVRLSSVSQQLRKSLAAYASQWIRFKNTDKSASSALAAFRVHGGHVRYINFPVQLNPTQGNIILDDDAQEIGDAEDIDDVQGTGNAQDTDDAQDIGEAQRGSDAALPVLPCTAADSLLRMAQCKPLYNVSISFRGDFENLEIWGLQIWGPQEDDEEYYEGVLDDPDIYLDAHFPQTAADAASKHESQLQWRKLMAEA